MGKAAVESRGLIKACNAPSTLLVAIQSESKDKKFLLQLYTVH